jgi:hypothetical protein
MAHNDYAWQIELGKQIVTDYIQKERPDYAARINALNWLFQDFEAFAQDLWRLELIAANERGIISFPEEHLADAWGTPGGDVVLKKRVDEYFRDFPRE